MLILEKENNVNLESRSGLLASKDRVRKAILQAPSACGQDHIYECCRLTALMIVKAEMNSVPLRVAVQDTEILEDLQRSLKHTDAGSELWGQHIGLLFWVIVLANAAAYHTPYHLFTTSILTNLMFEACFAEYDLAVALTPLKGMISFEEYCRTGRSLPIR